MITKKSEDPVVHRITVKIMNDDYTIIGSDPPDYIYQMITQIEERIVKIQEAHGAAKLSKTQLAVLVALQMCDRFCKLRMEHEKLVKLLQDAK